MQTNLSPQLHLANIANVAYGYARALRQSGRQANVLCYDLTHVLSMPEWADGDFEIDIEDEWAPPLDHPLLADARPPEWYSRIRSKDFWVSQPDFGSPRIVDPRMVEALVQESKRYGPRWALTPEDIHAYVALTNALSTHFFGRHAVIFGYAYGAIPPLLSGMEPYVPVEIGTLRDTFNLDTPQGRLLALAYRTAPHTIITNADCLSCANALGMERFSYVPHPVDEDVFAPLPAEKRLELKRSLCTTPYLMVAPARQSWSVKSNDRYLRAFAELVHGGVEATLMISEWGPDVARAKRYCEELGIGNCVQWFKPVPEGRLARMFNAADLVLDQFGDFGTFGLIGPKALSCGTPCLLSFDPRLHEWCFSETPPAIGVSLEADIVQAMRRLLSDEPARTELGRRSREWVLKHHSKAVAVGKIDAILASLQEGQVAASTFAALRSRKLAAHAAAGAASGAAAGRTPPAAGPGCVQRLGRRFRQYLQRLKQIAGDIRRLRQDRCRLAQVEQSLAEVKSTADQLSGELQRAWTRLTEMERRGEAAPAAMDEMRRQSQAEVMGVLALMGQYRLEDRQLLTQTRTELLETVVRSRMAVHPLIEEAAAAAVPTPTDRLPVAEAFRRLEAAAPLNWQLFLDCLKRGTDSYRDLPPGSCSTEAHPQALLFKAFLRPYLRGWVLDVGCGPQAVPFYLTGYPCDRICGVDPISQPEDHPFRFVPGVGEFLPFDDGVFDVVISGTTLDHYYLLDRGLESAFRVLKPGGHLVAWITEFKGSPAYDPYRVAMKAAYDEEHLYHIDREWFLPLMKSIGFNAVEVLHFELPFNYLFMSFEKPANGAAPASAP